MSYRVQEFTLASLYPAWQSVLSWFIPFKVLNPELKTKHLPFGLLLSAHSILGGRWDKTTLVQNQSLSTISVAQGSGTRLMIPWACAGCFLDCTCFPGWIPRLARFVSSESSLERRLSGHTLRSTKFESAWEQMPRDVNSLSSLPSRA